MSKPEQKPDIPDGITVRLNQCAAFLQPAEKFAYESQFPVAENDANTYRERFNLTEAETKIVLLHRKATILTDLIRKVYDLRPDAFHVRPNREGVMVVEEIATACGIEQALQVSVDNIIALAIERFRHVG
jgi:hypothetical protein